MVLWFVAFSMAGVFLVFRDPRIDFRAVAAGSLLPDLVDGLWRRGVWAMHSVVTTVCILALVMIATIGRRSIRRRALALTVGLFAHLVLDGAWTNTQGFWWPLLGSLPNSPIPSVDRGLGLVVVEELAGLCVAVWLIRRFSLAEQANRSRLLRTGALS